MFNQISLLRGGASQEMFTFSFGGSSGNLLVAGSNAQVLLWDWRNSKQVACLEESHMDDVTQVMNAETSVAKVGFFGNMYQKLWCLTHIETLSVWDWNDGSRELNIEDARSLATDKWNLDQVSIQ
nr:unnamed protein product [Digitaria exilis]